MLLVVIIFLALRVMPKRVRDMLPCACGPCCPRQMRAARARKANHRSRHASVNGPKTDRGSTSGEEIELDGGISSPSEPIPQRQSLAEAVMSLA